MAIPGPPPPGAPHDPGRPDPAPAWAPFPVQDWDAYRRSLATSAPPPAPPSATAGPPPTSFPPPTGFPPPAPRRRSLPALVVVVLATLLLTGLVAASSRHSPPPRPAWLPADGTAASVEVSWSDGAGSAEQAIGPAASILLSLPPELGDGVVSAVSEDGAVGDVRLLRQTVTPSVPTDPQLVAVYTIDGGLGLVGQSLVGAETVSFDPGLPLLPDPVPSGAWSDTGTWRAAAGENTGTGTYTVTLSAEAADAQGCQAITGSLTLVDEPFDVAVRVCAGRGIVGAVLPSAAFDAGEAAAAAADAAPVAPYAGPAPSGEPAARTVSFPGAGVASDPYGSLLPLPPLVAGDRLVVGDRSGEDLVLLRHLDGADDASPWLTITARLHPGGTLLAAAAIRGTILATTSTRGLTAWDSAGQRLWTVTVDDPIAAAPLELDATRILTVSATGTVQVRERSSGELVWSRRLPPDTYAVPAITGGVVLVGGPHGLYALDAATGTITWDNDVAVSHVAAAGGTFLVSSSDLLTGYDVAGERTFQLRQHTSQALVSLGDDVLDAGDHFVSRVGSDGTVHWRQPIACSAPFIAGDWVLCWEDSHGTVVDLATGNPGATTTIDSQGVAPLITDFAGHVVIMAGPWQVWTW